MAWEYLPVLNICLQILFTVGVGAIFSKILPLVFDPAFVQHTTQFVFYIAIPALVIKGIGVSVDFYSEIFIWKYIAAFLLLRCFSFLFVLAVHLLKQNDNGIHYGTIAAHWLSLTWISTIVMGVPILTVVMNSPQKGLFYGVLAGISSFIFQLPFLLFLFEYDKSKNELQNRDHGLDMSSNESSKVAGYLDESPHERNDTNIDINETVNTQERSNSILWRMLHNPIILGILIGFIISLSTFGKRFLNPTTGNQSLNEHYLEWLQFFVDTLGWFGGCVSPLSLFSMGAWMQNRGRHIITVETHVLILFMVLKLVFVPLLMVGIAKVLKLENEVGKAAVLISTLPISMASFSLGNTYSIGQSQLSANVAAGTLLMLPTVMMWNYAIDKIEIF
jgi:predicted permease